MRINRCVFDDTANEYLKNVTPTVSIFDAPIVTNSWPPWSVAKSSKSVKWLRSRAPGKVFWGVRCGLESFLLSSLKGSLLFFKSDKKNLLVASDGVLWNPSQNIIHVFLTRLRAMEWRRSNPFFFFLTGSNTFFQYSLIKLEISNIPYNSYHSKARTLFYAYHWIWVDVLFHQSWWFETEKHE